MNPIAQPVGLPTRTTISAQPSAQAEQTQTPVQTDNHSSTSGQADTIDISALGRTLASQMKTSQSDGKHSDINDSDLPAEVQRLLKLIRELKQQLQEQQQQLMEVMADTALDEEARKLALAGIQASIGTLSGALINAYNALIQLFKDLDMSSEQITQATALIMK